MIAILPKLILTFSAIPVKWPDELSGAEIDKVI